MLVMVANQGRMPVDVQAARQMAPEDLPYLLAGESGKHVAMPKGCITVSAGLSTYPETAENKE
jgi:hypothetical protein